MNDWRRGFKKWRKAKADFSNAQKILDKRESAIEAGIKPVDPADAEDTPTFALSYAHKKQASRSGKKSSRRDPKQVQLVEEVTQGLLDLGFEIDEIPLLIARKSIMDEELKEKAKSITVVKKTIGKYIENAIKENKLEFN